MEFTKEIGSILFDGYWKGGADGNPRHRQGKGEPKPFEEAIQKSLGMYIPECVEAP